MGLINWFKDKAFLNLEHDVKMMKTDIQVLEAKLDNCLSQIKSVRNRASKSSSESEDSSDSSLDLDAIRKAFGGDLPIELREKNIRR